MSFTLNGTVRDEDHVPTERVQVRMSADEAAAFIRQAETVRLAQAAGEPFGAALAVEIERGPVVGYVPGEPAAIGLDEDGVPTARYGDAA